MIQPKENPSRPQQVENDGEPISYRAHPAISQSELKLLIYDPDKFFSVRETKAARKSYFDIGSAIDYLVAGGNLLNIEDKITFIEKRPTGKLFEISSWLIANDLEPTDENILAARQEVGYDKRLTDKNVILKFNEEGGMWYYDVLLNSADKIILDSDDWDIVSKVFASLKNNRYTKQYLTPQPDVIRLHHVQIYYRYLGVDLKAELDQIDIDINNKTITPIDYKTTYDSTREFTSKVKRLRYDIQAASYTHALSEYVLGRATSPSINVDVSEYKILPFRFIVETTDPQRVGICPIIYECTKEVMLGGFWGSYPMGNKYIPAGPSVGHLFHITPLMPGFHTLIESYLFHKRTGERNYTQVEVENLETRGAVPLYI